MSDAPDVIYLQWIPGYPRVDADDEVTWCQDQINDDDIGYVREDIAASRLELLREAKDAIEHGYYSRTLIERIEKELGDD